MPRRRYQWTSDEDKTEEPTIRRTYSEKKAGNDAINDLRGRLLVLKPHELRTIPMSDFLRREIKIWQRIPSYGARKRQMHLVGRHLRMEDIPAIEAALGGNTETTEAREVALAELEHWRNRMIRGKDDSTEEFLSSYPTTERKHLRQLVRQAQKEEKARKAAEIAPKLPGEKAKAVPAGKAFRSLFRYLREHTELAQDRAKDSASRDSASRDSASQDSDVQDDQGR